MSVSAISSNSLHPNILQQSTRKVTPPPPAEDTVKISAAAKSLQERSAAPDQTVEAASSGDLQARAQLAQPAQTHSIKK